MKQAMTTLALALALVSACSEDSKGKGDAGTDSDTDADSDSDTGDVCDDPSYGVEEVCSLPDEPCPCDLFCDQEWTDAENQTQFFYQFYCYQTCEEEQTDESCPGEHDICYYVQTVDEHLCLVEGQLTGEAWETVVIPAGEDPTDADLLPVDFTLTLGDVTVYFTEVWGVDTGGSYANIVLVLDGVGSDNNYWHMEIKFPTGEWSPGTFEVKPAGAPWGSAPPKWVIAWAGFYAGNAMQNQCSTSGGEMVVTEANPPEPCLNPPDCVTSSGEAFQIDLVGFKLVQ